MALCSTGYGKGPPRSTSSTSACSSPSRRPKGVSSQLSLPSGPRHAVLNYFAYGIVVFVVRGIGVYRVALAQSRPLTGSRVKKVSTTCRLRVDHVYSGTLSGTLILVAFSCHKTGTSSTSMERLQTGSLSNYVLSVRVKLSQIIVAKPLFTRLTPRPLRFSTC